MTRYINEPERLVGALHDRDAVLPPAEHPPPTPPLPDGTVTGPPDFVIKFDGELTPEQLASLRSMWEAAMRPEQSLVVRGIIAQAVREEREACAQLADERANDTIGELGRVDIPLFEVANQIRARSQP